MLLKIYLKFRLGKKKRFEEEKNGRLSSKPPFDYEFALLGAFCKQYLSEQLSKQLSRSCKIE